MYLGLCSRLKLRAKCANVAIDDVAPDDEVGPPQRVEYLLAREHAPRVRGQ